MKKKSFCFFIFVIQSVFANPNPFFIDFPEKQNLTTEDYIQIQKQIRQINIEPLVKNLYKGLDTAGSTTFEDFFKRCSKGTNQILIDPEKDLYPIKELVQIGNGGDRCVVCCGPFNGKYPYYIKTLIQGLKDQGFNGSFLYLIGGWPNPTGEEIKYVAVPYSFKIFTMLEAYKLGFNNVLWIDAACFPLRNIDPLFDFISQKGALLNCFLPSKEGWRYILPQTHALLDQLTGTNVLNTYYINTIVFGLKMNSPQTQELIKIYYEFAEMGPPFLSCFPEEWVLTAIIGKKTFRRWNKSHRLPLVRGPESNEEDSLATMERLRKKGVYFYHRPGR